MTGQALLTEIIGILTGGIVAVGESIGSALSALATSIFLQGTGDTQSLSVFGVIIVIFAGISLALGLTRLIVNWLSNLGSSHL